MCFSPRNFEGVSSKVGFISSVLPSIMLYPTSLHFVPSTSLHSILLNLTLFVDSVALHAIPCTALDSISFRSFPLIFSASLSTTDPFFSSLIFPSFYIYSLLSTVTFFSVLFFSTFNYFLVTRQKSFFSPEKIQLCRLFFTIQDYSYVIFFLE